MPTRTDRDQTWDAQGNLLADVPVDRDISAETVRARAAGALASNATFLALATPTAAQTTAQVQRLTKQCNALIRLLLNQLDDISGT